MVGVDVRRPLKVVDAGVTAVSAGGDTTCAVVAGGLHCWGANRFGQVGNGVPSEAVASPLPVIAKGVTAVASGGQHSCAVVDGDLRCWGFMPELENGPRSVQVLPWTMISGGVTAVAAATRTCAVVRGALQCWGRNFHGQVGVAGGPTVAPKTPQTIVERGVTQVVVNDRNTCAVADGALHCWGDNANGQLGTVSPPVPLPRQVLDGGVTAAGVGMNMVCAVAAGVLQCTHRTPMEDAPAQDWRAFGAVPTPFSTPDPVLPRLPVYGIWRGTLGRQEVMVNLQPEDCGSSYYYLRHLWGITLAEKGKRAERWHEGRGDARATWTLDSATETALEGTWADASGQRRLPLRLKRVASVGGGKTGECTAAGLDVFNAPRLKAKAPVRAEYRFQGQAWPALEVPGLDLRALDGTPSGPALPRLKRFMRQWLDSQVLEYFDCQTGLADFSEGKAQTPEFRAEWEPVLWTERWLALRETYSSFCGGAHPNGGVMATLTWDLSADREVDPWRWLRVGKTEFGGRDLPPALKALLAKIYAKERGSAEDEDCRDAIERIASYRLAPAAEGLVFMPELPHVVQACADDIVVPWAQLAPFLTPAGAAVARSGFAGAKTR